jgi:hypothetical protein
MTSFGSMDGEGGRGTGSDDDDDDFEWKMDADSCQKTLLWKLDITPTWTYTMEETQRP